MIEVCDGPTGVTVIQRDVKLVNIRQYTLNYGLFFLLMTVISLFSEMTVDYFVTYFITVCLWGGL